MSQVSLQPPLKRQRADDQLATLAAFTTTNSFLIVNSPSSTTTSTTTTTARDPQRQLVYQAQHSNLQYERRELIVQSYTIFNSLQKIAHNFDSPRNDSNMTTTDLTSYLARVINLYKQTVLNQFQLIQDDSTLNDATKLHSLTHHASLHSILSLTQILYMPFDGQGQGLVGEEILDWLNTIDTAPTSQEGQELIDMARPWEHSNFWTCIIRGHMSSAKALIEIIQTHSNPTLQNISKLICQSLQEFPRSTKFKKEIEFLKQFKIWKRFIEKQFNQIESLFDQDSSLKKDEKLDWLFGFKSLIELLQGNEIQILSNCQDWREALASYMILIDPTVKRLDLPQVLDKILETHPIDSTLKNEQIEISLIQNQILKVLQQSNEISIWLSSHLSDLFDKLDLIPTTQQHHHPQFEGKREEEEEESLRNYFILNYTDCLKNDETLWKIEIDYLITCQQQGLKRISILLENKSLNETLFSNKQSKQQESLENSNENHDETNVAQQILDLCIEYGLEHSFVKICKTFAQTLTDQQNFGQAISYCLRIKDWKKISIIVDKILDTYVFQGQETFINHVDSISIDSIESSSTINEFNTSSSKLNFLIQFKTILNLFKQNEFKKVSKLLISLISSHIVPKRFIGILLLDSVTLLKEPQLLINTEETYELLRCLEDLVSPILTNSNLSIPDVNNDLTSLALLTGSNQDDSNKDQTIKSLKQLDIVRQALAK
ncbi:hypothetical protein OIO90_005291 [Microbotryomycetes sp. JL221]|nr:hypothetical protein OIO90_005291 [Microbotryomycetes sp. JL221]